MISILLDANNGLDSQFTYLNELSTSSSNQIEVNSQSQPSYDFEESTLQEHYITNFCQDPIYEDQSQQEVKIIEPIIPKDQAYQSKQEKIVGQNFKTLPKTSISQTKQMKQQNGLFHQQKIKTKQSKKTKKDQYPTKNFLPCFRSSFINYLAQYFQPKYFQNFEVIKRIRGKKCISMIDYQDIFNERQFEPILETYFRKRIIFHHLMTSRIDFDLKKLYFKRINVFQTAFRRGVFQRIN